MSSGIGPRGLLLMKALGAVLGVNDPRQAPARLKVDELIPTISMDPGMAGLESWQVFASVSLAGVAVATWQPLGPGAAASFSGMPAQGYIENTTDKEAVILGHQMAVEYNAAGRNADAAALEALLLTELRQAAGSTLSMVPCSNFRSWAVINATDLIYIWSHPWWQVPGYIGVDPSVPPLPNAFLSHAPVYVPAGSRYALSIGKRSGAAWPAGTLLTVSAFGVFVPKGMRPPGF